MSRSARHSMTQQKISRKDIAKMSFRELLRASHTPYRRLFSYLKPYRFRFALGILFGALFGLVQALLVFDVQFVAGAVFSEHDPKAPSVLVRMFPQLAQVHLNAGPRDNAGLGTVLLICASIPMLMALRGLCSYLNSYCMLWVSVRVLDDIRKQVFRHTLEQSMEFFNRTRGGDLVQTVFNQTRMAQQALTNIASDIVKQPISILCALGALFVIDWRFTLMSFVIFPLCLVPVVLVSRKVRQAGRREEEEAGQIMVVMHEAFTGIRVVKTHAREDFESRRFNTANQQIMRFMMRWQKALEMSGPLVETIASLGVAAALVYTWKRDLGFTNFMALNGGLLMLYPSMKALSRMYLLMQKCLASTTKVFELLDSRPAIQDAPGAIALPPMRREIRFEEVSFSYGTRRSAVENVTLTIPAGTTCALVGASGAGKSTLLALLQRLYDTRRGAIRIDGHDIRAVTQVSLRENIATVSQDTFLFHDTIANNIRYGRLDATREEIEGAAKLAFAHEFILQQPDGYETVIGDKGCLLSGGQQQRVSIARALLKNAPILLLDEAYSALDSEAEKQIHQALETLAAGRTVIAIAHRLSTILKADQIVVMEEGQIKEIGTHRQLFAQSGYYRRLYDLQFQHHQGEEVPLAELAAAT
ncbi:MAG: ABC transporter ATP-binding protein/permease [Verrucomicrobiota bacterium]|nr:ABC transporter ATP-binding protein/permease [Verrucomicrobiota bacterium]